MTELRGSLSLMVRYSVLDSLRYRPTRFAADSSEFNRISASVIRELIKAISSAKFVSVRKVAGFLGPRLRSSFWDGNDVRIQPMFGTDIVIESNIAELQKKIMEVIILPNDRRNIVRSKRLAWFSLRKNTF